MNERDLFAERLKAAMEKAGYESRPVVLEREFNLRYWGKPVTFQAVRRWLRGEAIPAQDKLLVLADWLGVDPHLLRFGSQAGRKVRGIKEELRPNADEEDILRAYRRLPAPQRRAVQEIITALAKAGSSDA